ncbi:MAG: GNAT family N-acetyltransferase [Candidatus Marsarchaeota archaeon]|jgi:GNAT superfamily N-acetyltransferase|nr:GNAT family N-acetyltransferase [Candidatus Marsarchaeota archaeon]MCL5419178.1 GNAT family N-acetyltransferase [Candidatus Marsarchaeota archaeon]
MEIIRANRVNKYITDALRIAHSLKEWFNENGVKSMEADLFFDNLIVAVEGNETIGFACYSSYDGIMQLIWLAVERGYQGRGVGTKLLNWVEDEARSHGIALIQVETLPDEHSYEPYKLTRKFYYNNGFVRVAYKKARLEGWDDQVVLEKRL